MCSTRFCAFKIERTLRLIKLKQLEDEMDQNNSSSQVNVSVYPFDEWMDQNFPGKPKTLQRKKN
jgi:hypothetical protein